MTPTLPVQEQPFVEPVKQPRMSAFGCASTRTYFDSACENLDMSTISFDSPSGQKPGHVVQSIHSLLRSDSRDLGAQPHTTQYFHRSLLADSPSKSVAYGPLLSHLDQ